jgi:anti-sigma factor RsiW
VTFGHPITEDDLHAYIDKALDPARSGEVEAYIARHAEVAHRIRRYAAQRDALRAALAPIAEEPVPPELSLKRLIEKQRHPRFYGWRSVAAAALLLVLGSAGGWSLRGALEPTPGGMTALAQEAAESYAVYGTDHVHPVEFKAADSDAMIRWISSRLQHPITVPDLTKSGYRFMGGRLVATAHGPAGLFMYDDDHGTRLALLVRPMTVDQTTTRMSEHSSGSVAGFAWADQGVGYSVVGAAPSQALHPLADEMRRQVSAKL